MRKVKRWRGLGGGTREFRVERMRERERTRGWIVETNRKDTATRVMVPMTVTIAEDCEKRRGQGQDPSNEGGRGDVDDLELSLTFRNPRSGQIKAGRAISLLLEAWKDRL